MKQISSDIQKYVKGMKNVNVSFLATRLFERGSRRKGGFSPMHAKRSLKGERLLFISAHKLLHWLNWFRVDHNEGSPLVTLFTASSEGKEGIRRDSGNSSWHVLEVATWCRVNFAHTCP